MNLRNIYIFTNGDINFTEHCSVKIKILKIHFEMNFYLILKNLVLTFLKKEVVFKKISSKNIWDS